MEHLQALINKRAEKKLKEHIKTNFLKALIKLPYKDLVDKFPPEKYYSWSVESILNENNSTGEWIREKLFDALITEWTEKEAEDFLKEIEGIKSQIAGLQEQIDYLPQG